MLCVDVFMPNLVEILLEIFVDEDALIVLSCWFNNESTVPSIVIVCRCSIASTN